MFSLLTTLVLAATAVVQVQATTVSPNCDRNATIVLGDTCNSISAQYNVSTYQLAEVNADIINTNCTNLYPGEDICLGLQGQDCNTTYIVQPDDTCVGIAYAYSIPESTLLTNNPNVNSACTNIYPDEVLCVSSTIYVNSTASGSS